MFCRPTRGLALKVGFTGVLVDKPGDLGHADVRSGEVPTGNADGQSNEESMTLFRGDVNEKIMMCCYGVCKMSFV